MIVGKAGKRDIQSEYSFQILLNIGDIKLDTVYKSIMYRFSQALKGLLIARNIK